MVYPNYKGKHMEDALFHPEEFFAYKKFSAKFFPQKWIITFQSSVERYARRRYKLKREKDIPFHRNVPYFYKGIGFLRVIGIGSPHTIVVFEELIALGAREFIVVGTAGGLQDQGVYVCEKSIRDEGTSAHYLAHDRYALPDKKLTAQLESSLLKAGVPFQRGVSWTIDAPYRETKAEIQKYKKEGVSCVEMEASALFVVARFRKVRVAAVFVVSDVVGEEKWEPNFDDKHIRGLLNKSLDAAVMCFRRVY